MKIPEFYKILNQREHNQYLVLNEVTNVVCILKVLTVFDEFVYKYLEENKNKFTPTIYDLQRDDDKLYVFEEFIQGDTLADYLLKNDISDGQKLNILLQICEALTFLHGAPRPIIHRDLKPTNIMITSGEQIKLIDYDASRSYKVGKEEDTVFVGTQKYAAPEQYGFAQSDARTDVFAMGKIIKELFPNDKNMLKISDKACQIDANLRYQSAKELSRALKSGSAEPGFWNRLFRLPGFRTKTWWKMILGSIYYFMALFLITFLSLNSHDWGIGRHIFYRVNVGLMFFFWMDILCDWVGLWKHVPPLNSKNKNLRITFRIIYCIILFVISRYLNLTIAPYLYPYT